MISVRFVLATIIIYILSNTSLVYAQEWVWEERVVSKSSMLGDHLLIDTKHAVHLPGELYPRFIEVEQEGIRIVYVMDEELLIWDDLYVHLQNIPHLANLSISGMDSVIYLSTYEDTEVAGRFLINTFTLSLNDIDAGVEVREDLTAVVDLEPDEHVRHVVLGDLNNDNLLDYGIQVKPVNLSDNMIYIAPLFQGEDEWVFGEWSELIPILDNDNFFSVGISIVDFNSDGDSELLSTLRSHNFSDVGWVHDYSYTTQFLIDNINDIPTYQRIRPPSEEQWIEKFSSIDTNNDGFLEYFAATAMGMIEWEAVETAPDQFGIREIKLWSPLPNIVTIIGNQQEELNEYLTQCENSSTWTDPYGHDSYAYQYYSYLWRKAEDGVGFDCAGYAFRDNAGPERSKTFYVDNQNIVGLEVTSFQPPAAWDEVGIHHKDYYEYDRSTNEWQFFDEYRRSFSLDNDYGPYDFQFSLAEIKWISKSGVAV
ncbi:hypothetical protein K8I28_09675 [bacterium]|nr:hypothetical protein [bacterium]